MFIALLMLDVRQIMVFSDNESWLCQSFVRNFYNLDDGEFSVLFRLAYPIWWCRKIDAGRRKGLLNGITNEVLWKPLYRLLPGNLNLGMNGPKSWCCWRKTNKPSEAKEVAWENHQNSIDHLAVTSCSTDEKAAITRKDIYVKFSGVMPLCVLLIFISFVGAVWISEVLESCYILQESSSQAL